MRTTTLFVSMGLAIVFAALATNAEARWSPELTTHIWDTSSQCLGDSSGAYATPGRPSGGWYEHRFDGSPNPASFARIPVGWNASYSYYYGGTDATRFCPRT